MKLELIIDNVTVDPPEWTLLDGKGDVLASGGLDRFSGVIPYELTEALERRLRETSVLDKHVPF